LIVGRHQLGQGDQEGQGKLDRGQREHLGRAQVESEGKGVVKPFPESGHDPEGQQEGHQQQGNEKGFHGWW